MSGITEIVVETQGFEPPPEETCPKSTTRVEETSSLRSSLPTATKKSPTCALVLEQRRVEIR